MDNIVNNSLKDGMGYLVKYYETVSGPIPLDLHRRISILDCKGTHDEMMALKQFNPDVDKFREDYKRAIIAAILLYVTDPRTAEYAFLFAMTTAYSNMMLSAWVDAGATLPVNHDTSQWLAQREADERKYIEALFVTLALLLQRPDFGVEAWATNRADGYIDTLFSIYTIGFLRAKIASGHDSDLYEFQGESGAESCKECQDLLGKQKTAQEIIANNLIPFPGNTDSFTCGGWKCQHYWKNVKTGEVLEA